MLPITSQHSLLRMLPTEGAERLLSCLTLVELPRGPLSPVYKNSPQVYLPLTATIPLETLSSTGESTLQVFLSQTHLIGIERIVAPQYPIRTTVVSAGHCLRGDLEMINQALTELKIESPLYVATLRAMVQVNGYNGICVAYHSSEQRLARLLLEADQEFPNDGMITLSQVELANFLNVRRETVAIHLSYWKTNRIIDTRRGRITIVDRGRFEKISCECWRYNKECATHNRQRVSEIISSRQKIIDI